MSRVLTNEKNYYDIADTIRQMKEVDTTYKPREMASALKDIYSNEVEGTLPLSFEANGNNLLNYRIDGASGGVGERTKNLLQNTATSQTINGVTFTVNNDKSITCNGTATGTAAITINTIFSINSTKISGCPMGGSWSSFELDLLNINTNNVDVMDTGNGAVIQNENSYRVRIRIASGYTCNNLTFYPMIRKADIEDDTYEPYGYKVPVVVTGKNIYNNELYPLTAEQLIYGSNGTTAVNSSYSATLDYIPISEYAGQTIILNKRPGGISPGIAYYDENYVFISGTKNNRETAGAPMVSNVPSNAIYMRFTVPINATNIQIELEPTITNIYLNTPIEENESISLSDTEVDIPTIEGTNVLTIDTTVQPSNVYVQAPKDNEEIVFLTQVLEEGI